MDSSNLADIIFFAAIAGFLIYRLRSVLGRKDFGGDTNSGNLTRFKGGMAEKIKSSAKEITAVPAKIVGDKSEAKELEDLKISDPVAAAVVEEMKKIDGNFTAISFVTGAKTAFEMVIDSLAKGDKETLSALLSKEVYDEFEREIAARTQPGEKHETTLIAVTSADIVKATLDGKMASIGVKFSSEQVDVTKNDKGEIINGDPSHIAEVEDVWTFSHNFASPDPNWKLTGI